MCGRMFQTLPLRRLLQIARTKNVMNPDLHSVSYNICPTTYIPVIKHSNLYPEDKKKQQMAQEANENREKDEKQLKSDRELTFMKWGQKTNFNMIINGRIEELTSKRTFMKCIENRCVVIMEGYYEWKEKDKPYSFKPKNSDHFLVAGLYTQENEIIILTKDAASNINHIHQRMPAMLTESEVQLWLDPKNTASIQQIIKNSICNKEKALWKNIGFAELGPHVNKREQKSVKCLMTIEDYKKELDKKGLMRFWKKPEKTEKKDKESEQKNEKSGVSAEKQKQKEKKDERKQFLYEQKDLQKKKENEQG